MTLLPFSAIEMCGSIKTVIFHVFLLRMFIDFAKMESALKLPLTGCSVGSVLPLTRQGSFTLEDKF